MKFSVKDTTRVKGVAILFLYAYHCFSQTKRMAGYPVSFYPFSQEVIMYICDAMNICVGMFTFLSVYGLTISCKKINASLEISKKQYAESMIKRYIKLMMNFWVIFLIFEILHPFFSNEYEYGISKIDIVSNFLTDMFGFTYILSTPRLCGAWWYMGLAVFIICIMPFCLNLYRKYGISILILFVFIPLCFIAEATHMTRWLLTIPFGIICADCGVLERLKATVIFSKIKNKQLNKIFKFILLTVVFIVFIKLRESVFGRADGPRYLIDGTFSVFAVYYVYEFFVDMPYVGEVLEFLGKHSLNMFLTHTFIRWVWFREFTYSLKYAIVIYGFLLVTTILISVAIEALKKVIKYSKFIKFVQNKVLAALKLQSA